jgi:hypothetical protein
MNGGSAHAPPGAPHERLAGPAPRDAARPSAGKAAATKPGEKAAPGHPEPADAAFSAVLVVAAVAAPRPPPTVAGPVAVEPPALPAAPLSRQKSDARPTARRDDGVTLRVPEGSASARDAAAGTVPAAAAPAEPRETAPSSAPPPPPPGFGGGNVAGAVLARAAHLTLDDGRTGEIGLHLRIRDGVANLRIDGGMAGLVEARSAELRLALAREGLQLELAAGGGDASRHGPPDAPDPVETGGPAGSTGPAAARAAGPRPATDGRGGRIDVEA